MDEEKIILTPEQEEAVAKQKEYITKMGDIFSECWEDEDFKNRFVADPVSVLHEYGIETEQDVEYIVIQAPVRTQYCVLPHENTKAAMKSVTDYLSGVVEDKDNFLPDGWEMRIIQNTEDKRYLVLPFSPEELTPEELAMVSGGGWFFGRSFIITSSVLIAVTHGIAVTEVAAATVAAVAAVVAAVAVAVTV